MDFNPNQQLIQRHAKRLTGLEDMQARIMLAKYRVAFQELKNRLLSAGDNTFTEARLKSTISQVEISIKLLEKELSKTISESSSYCYEQAVEDSVTEINKFEKDFAGVSSTIPIDVILDSTEENNLLINNFASSIMAYNSDLRANIQNSLTQSLIQNKTYSQSVDDIDSILNTDLWKAHRIVRTEMHSIYNISKIDGMLSIRDKYIPDLKKMLIHPMDNRTAQDSKELAKQNPIVDIEKPFVQVYNGKKYVFMAPPNRPNDRAILIPFREKYIATE